MAFWVLAALLTLLASLAVFIPLSREPARRQADAAHDGEVYRDQLGELERDAARGLIGPAEAEEARAEIGRRLLKASAAAGAEATSPPSGRAGRMIAAAAVLAVPLVSWSIYGAIGSPDLPSQPLAGRLAGNAAQNPADAGIDELIARAESHLAANPDDGRGWAVLAPIYLRIGRLDEAATAYRSAIRLSGASGSLEAGLGEALAAIAGGVITADAQGAFERALALEPGQPKASFYLAAALAQEGRRAEADAAFGKLAASLPADSPWRSAIAGASGQTTANAAPASAAPAQPGPDQAAVDAAARMPQADRDAMVAGMVDSLDKKLRGNPQDPAGWMRLVRSYVVLGRTDAARDAARRGVEAIGEATDEGRQLLALAASLGVPVTQ